MTSALIIGGGLLLIVAVLWYALREAQERGRLEAEKRRAEDDAELAEAQGRVIAEHREPGDASERLRRGDF